MNTRNSAANFIIPAVILIAGWYPRYVFAGPVHIYGGDFDLPIPALDDPQRDFGRGRMADAVIEVTDHFTIYDIDVAISLKHTNSTDLQIFLQSPTKKRICLNMYDPRDFPLGEDYTQTIFDDEAPNPIEQAMPPFRGRFKPRQGNQLKVFDGEDVYGNWRLQIHDVFYDDIGNLESFEIIVTVPEPATVIFLTFGATLAGLRKPTRE